MQIRILSILPSASGSRRSADGCMAWHWFPCCSVEFQFEDKSMVDGRVMCLPAVKWEISLMCGFKDGWWKYRNWWHVWVKVLTNVLRDFFPKEKLLIWLQKGWRWLMFTCWIQGTNVCLGITTQLKQRLYDFHFVFSVLQVLFLADLFKFFQFSWTSRPKRVTATMKLPLSCTSKALCYWTSYNFLLAVYFFFVAP